MPGHDPNNPYNNPLGGGGFGGGYNPGARERERAEEATQERIDEMASELAESANEAVNRAVGNEPEQDDNCLPPPLPVSDGIVVGEEVYEQINFEDVNFDTFLVPTEPLPSEQNYSSTYLREINVFNLNSFFRYRGYQDNLVITTDQGEKRIAREEFRTQESIPWLASHISNVTTVIDPDLGILYETTPRDLYRVQNKYFRVLEGSEQAPIQDLWARDLIPEEEIVNYYETLPDGSTSALSSTDGYPTHRRSYIINFMDGFERTPEQKTAFFNSLFRPGIIYEDNCFTVPQPVEAKDLTNLEPVVANDCYVINFSSSVGIRNIPFDDNVSEPNMPHLYLDYYNHERESATGLASNISICDQNLLVQKYLASNQDMMKRANTSAIVHERHNTHISIEIRRPSCMTTSFNDFGQLLLESFKEQETDKYYLNTQHIEGNHRIVQKVLIEDDMVPINNVAPNDRFSITGLKTTEHDALSYAANLAVNESTREEHTRLAFDSKHHYPLKFTDHEDQDLLISNDALRLAQFADQAVTPLKERASYSYDNLKQGNTHSQSIIGYKIEKYIAGFESTPIQTIYLTEAYELEGSLKFIDSQVKYGSSYRYKIFSIVIHTGIKYSYSLSPNGETSSESNIKYRTTYRKYTKITEVPFYEKIVSLVDLPPLAPSVTFYPDKTNPNKLGLIFNHSVGEKIEKPIRMLASDRPTIENMMKNQNPTEDGKLLYYSDSLPEEYEVFVSSTPPVTYSDFAGQKGHTVPTNQRSTTFLEITSMRPNKTYWFLFRSKERGGISNPSLVYQYRMVSTQNGNYFTLTEYDLYKSRPEIVQKPFQRALKIEPAAVQKYINFGSSTQIDSRDFSLSAPSLSDVEIGDASLSEHIWDKDYKFRISSKMTGRKLDLNVNFGQKKSNRTDQQQIDTTMCDPALRPEDRPDPEEPQKIDCLKEIMMPALTYEVRHEKECKTPDGLEVIKKFDANWAVNWNTPDGYFNMNAGSGGTGVLTEHEEIFKDLIPGGLNPDDRPLDTRIELWLMKRLLTLHGDDLGGCRCTEDPSIIYDFVPPGPHKEADGSGTNMFWPIYGNGDNTYSQSSIIYPTSIPAFYNSEFGSYTWHDWFSLRQQWWTQFVGMTPEQAILQASSLHRRVANEFSEASPRDRLMATAMWNPLHGPEHEKVLRCLVNVQNLLYQAGQPSFDQPRGTEISPSPGITRISFFYKNLYNWGFLNSNFSNAVMAMDWACPQEKKEEEIKEEPPPEPPPEMPSGCDVTIDASLEEHDICPGEQFSIDPNLILNCGKNPYGTSSDMQIVLAPEGIGTLNCTPTIEGNTITITVPESSSTAHFTFLLLVSVNGAEYQTDYYKFEIINIAECNQPPVAVDFTVDGSSYEAGDTISVAIADILAVCTDPDGDTLALNSVYSAANGVNLSSANVTGTHINLVVANAGNAETRYSVRDPDGATSNLAKLKVINVQAPNDPPEAGNFELTVNPDNDIAFFIDQDTGDGTTGGAADTLLRNASDPDGDVLTVVNPLVEGSPHIGLGYGGDGLNPDNSKYALTVKGFFESHTVPMVTYSISDPSGDTSSGIISITGGFIRKAYEIPSTYEIDVSSLNKTMGQTIEFALTDFNDDKFVTLMDPNHDLQSEGQSGGSAVEHNIGTVGMVQNCSAANVVDNSYFSAFSGFNAENKLKFSVKTDQVQTSDPVVKIKFKIASRLIQNHNNPVYAASTQGQRSKTLNSNECILTITGMKSYVPPPPTCDECKEMLNKAGNACVPKSPYIAGPNGTPVLPDPKTGYRWETDDKDCNPTQVKICDKGTYDEVTKKCMTSTDYEISFSAVCPAGEILEQKAGFTFNYTHTVTVEHEVGLAPSQRIVENENMSTIKNSQSYKAWKKSFSCQTPEIPCPPGRVKNNEGDCVCPEGYSPVPGGMNCMRYALVETVQQTFRPRYQIRPVMMVRAKKTNASTPKAWKFLKNNTYADVFGDHPALKHNNNPFDHLLLYGFLSNPGYIWYNTEGSEGHLAKGFSGLHRMAGFFARGSTTVGNFGGVVYGLDQSYMQEKKFHYQHGKPDYIETHITAKTADTHCDFGCGPGDNRIDFTHRPHYASAQSMELGADQNPANGGFYRWRTHREVMDHNAGGTAMGFEAGHVRGETGHLTSDTSFYGDFYSQNVLHQYREDDTDLDGRGRQRKYGQLDNEYSLLQYTRMYTYSPSEDFIIRAGYMRHAGQGGLTNPSDQDPYNKASRMTDAEFQAVRNNLTNNGRTGYRTEITQTNQALFRDRSKYQTRATLMAGDDVEQFDLMQRQRYEAVENYRGRFRDGFWAPSGFRQKKWLKIYDYVIEDPNYQGDSENIDAVYRQGNEQVTAQAVLDNIPRWLAESEANDPIKYGLVVEKIINDKVTDVYYLTEKCPWKPGHEGRNGESGKRNGKWCDRFPQSGCSGRDGMGVVAIRHNSHLRAGNKLINEMEPYYAFQEKFLPYGPDASFTGTKSNNQYHWYQMCKRTNQQMQGIVKDIFDDGDHYANGEKPDADNASYLTYAQATALQANFRALEAEGVSGFANIGAFYANDNSAVDSVWSANMITLKANHWITEFERLRLLDDDLVDSSQLTRVRM